MCVIFFLPLAFVAAALAILVSMGAEAAKKARK
jgi:hypothetical protein